VCYESRQPQTHRQRQRHLSAVYSSDNQEQVTVSVEGAEPLYAEIRIPNKQGWRLGQKVVVMIAPVSADDGWDSST